MRLGAWLCASVALLGGACSGGYPLEPTACDDWCNATKGRWIDWCGDYDPASCVSECEAQQLDHEECRPAYDAAAECYRTTPGATARRCYYDPNRPCQTEVLTLMTCSGSYIQYDDFTGGPVTPNL
jgi:hypothetical protein